MAAFAAGIGAAARRAVATIARRGIPAARLIWNSHTGSYIRQRARMATQGPPGSRRQGNIDRAGRALESIKNNRRTPEFVRRNMQRGKDATERGLNRAFLGGVRGIDRTFDQTDRAIDAVRNRAVGAVQGQHTRGEQVLATGAARTIRGYRRAEQTRSGRFARSAVKTGAVDIATFKIVEQLERWTQELERTLEQKQLSEDEKNMWIDRLEGGLETLNEDIEMIRRVGSMVAVRALITRSTKLIRRLRQVQPKVPEISPATATTVGSRIGEQARKYQKLYSQHRPEFYGSMAGTIGAIAYEQEHPIEAIGGLRAGGQTRLVQGAAQAAFPNVATATKAATVGSVRQVRRIRNARGR